MLARPSTSISSSTASFDCSTNFTSAAALVRSWSKSEPGPECHSCGSRDMVSPRRFSPFLQIHSPILSESGLRTAAQAPTERWAPSRLTTAPRSSDLPLFGPKSSGFSCSIEILVAVSRTTHRVPLLARIQSVEGSLEGRISCLRNICGRSFRAGGYRSLGSPRISCHFWTYLMTSSTL